MASLSNYFRHSFKPPALQNTLTQTVPVAKQILILAFRLSFSSKYTLKLERRVLSLQLLFGLKQSVLSLSIIASMSDLAIITATIVTTFLQT